MRHAGMLVGAMCVVLALPACRGGGATSASETGAATAHRNTIATAASCVPARVHYTPAPKEGRLDLSGLPWVRGGPNGSGVVALLWYWPRRWTHDEVSEGRIFAGGVAPAGYNVKVLWMFVSRGAAGRSGTTLVVRGTRIDGPGTFRQTFSRIGNGPPAYASIIDVPRPGCWRLHVASGRLEGDVELRAVPARRRHGSAS